MKKSTIILILALMSLSSYSQIRQSKSIGTNPVTTGNKLDYSRPQEYEIGEINITGTKYLDGNTLVSLTGLSVGDRVKVPGDDLSNAIKKLWKHGLVADVKILIDKIEDGKVFINVALTERPRLSRFEFDGITKTQEGELSDDIDFYKGKVLTDAIVKNTENNVRNHFIGKGFLNCEVKIQQIPDTIMANNHVRLKVIVDKKQKVKIDRIYFEGANEVSQAKMKGKLKDTKERLRFNLINNFFGYLFNLNVKSFLGSSNELSGNDLHEYLSRTVNVNFFKASKFIKKDFKTDKNLLVDHLNSKGYRDVVIVSDSVYKSGVNSINLKIKIEEGQKYYFRNITWAGNYVHSDEKLSSIFGMKKGDIYNREELNKRITMNPQGYDISGLYMDDGYLFFNINPVEVGVVGDSIDIEMRITEGAQATVNKVIISGNDRTNEHVILRELRTLPGQKFSRTNIIRDQQQLGQMGYFDPEQMNIVPVPNPVDNTVDIEYKLVERPSDQIELSGGWGGYYGFIGTLGLSFSNFSLKNITDFSKWQPLPVGDGQKLSLRAQANGKLYQSYTFMFSEPWLGGKKPTNFTFSINSSIQNNDIKYYEVGHFKVYSATLGVGKRLTWPDNYFTLSTSLTYKIYDLNNYRYGERSINFDTGRANTVLLNGTIARTSIDDQMFPKSGSTVSLAANFTPPFSKWRDIDYENAEPAELYKWVEYMKWMFDAKYYLNVVDKLVLESRVHFGLMNTYSPDVLEVSPFERFYMGGSGLAGQNFITGRDVIGLRGYDDGKIIPEEQSNANYTGVRDGTIFTKYSMEIRYPITSGSAATIYVYGFGEAGNNWSSYKNFNPFKAYKSAGLGARLFMPAFGLIGLNWGYGFDTLPNTDSPSGSKFQFTIGAQMR